MIKLQDEAEVILWSLFATQLAQAWLRKVTIVPGDATDAAVRAADRFIEALRERTQP